MTLEEAETLALSTLKQVMEEKVLETHFLVNPYLLFLFIFFPFVLLQTHTCPQPIMDEHHRISGSLIVVSSHFQTFLVIVYL
jgi:hypothetical protein